MAARKRNHLRAVASLHNGASPGSWMSLLASTTLGVDTAAATVHAEVRLDATDLASLSDDAHYRLIVQSYDSEGADGRSKPVGSVQRAISKSDLRGGVKVDLFELRGIAPHSHECARKPIVVAWIEAGQPNLEFDGRMARPAKDAVAGRARRNASPHVQITLSRTARTARTAA
ncbi:MAG: hypothetical protein JWM74_3138 [Myxococcaceae bacterium]|nr:hypothetical protein [Myxococcaceae bacterium]